MIAGRLIAPAMIVIVFATGVMLRGQRLQRPFVFHTILASVVVWQVTCVGLMAPDRDPAAAVGEPVGQWLQAHLPAGAVVAVNTAGSTPFFAPSLTFIDMLGLNDRHIARRRIEKLETTWQHIPGHLKGDGAYVLRRSPDVIILGPADGYLGDNPRAWFLTGFELLHLPEFRARYRAYTFAVPITPTQFLAPAVAAKSPSGKTLTLTAYVRRDSAALTRLGALGLPID